MAGRKGSTNLQACSLGFVASLCTYRCTKAGGTEQHEVKLPWTITFDGRYGELLYLSAQTKATITQ